MLQCCKISRNSICIQVNHKLYLGECGITTVLRIRLGDGRVGRENVVWNGVFGVTVVEVAERTIRNTSFKAYSLLDRIAL